jgi:pilus assembly protein CpaF
MNKQKNRKTDLEGRIMNKILARLYLNLVPTVGEGRARIEARLNMIDGYFGIERPPVLEIRRSAEELLESEEELGSEMRSRIVEELLTFSQGKFGQDFEAKLRARMEKEFGAILADEKAQLPTEEQEHLFVSIVTDTLGWGPLESLLADEAVTEILVDGPNNIYVERRGELEDVPEGFRDSEHLLSLIRRIFAPLGRRLDQSNPIVDARLADGSLVNVVLSPISLVGPALTIRRLPAERLTLEDLLRFGSLSEGVVEFLRACFHARLNMVIAGGTASGKTTLLNILTGMIPTGERVVTVESHGDLQPPEELEHLVRLASRPPNIDGQGEITMRDLVANALRMRPDRIILSECQGPEVFDILRAMNTGHDGTMFNLHANSPHDALARLETMAFMANPSLPLLQVRHEIASAIDLIVYQERMTDGTRKVTSVTEVAGMHGDAIMLQDIFEFRHTGVKEGRVTGYHTATGTIPKCFNRIREAGIELPMSLFTPS